MLFLVLKYLYIFIFNKLCCRIKVSFFVINFIDLCRNFKCIEFDSGNVNGYSYLLGFVLINIVIRKLC